MTTEKAWQLYADGLLTYFESRVNDASIAEDLRQEVFVKLHTQLPRIREKDKVQHWLRAVARNVMVDYWKAEVKNQAVTVPEEDTKQDEALMHLAEHCVNRMLDDLPATYAAPLKWSDIEGLPQAEVATRLGLSVSGAKSRIQRGREMLKDAIMGCCKPSFNARNELVDSACMHKDC